jgi:hypothetical protein
MRNKKNSLQTTSDKFRDPNYLNVIILAILLCMLAFST